MMKALLPVLALLAVAACAKTEQQSGSSMAPNSGFLGNYSNLQPETKGRPLSAISIRTSIGANTLPHLEPCSSGRRRTPP